MSVVTAVRVWPTRAVPVILGCPFGGLFGVSLSMMVRVAGLTVVMPEAVVVPAHRHRLGTFHGGVVVGRELKGCRPATGAGGDGDVEGLHRSEVGGLGSRCRQGHVHHRGR